jgi:hypothetical protein
LILAQTYADADTDNDGLLDPLEFQNFIQKATNNKDATLEEARSVLLAVTKKEDSSINFMQVMNSWHLIGGDIQGMFSKEAQGAKEREGGIKLCRLE